MRKLLLIFAFIGWVTAIKYYPKLILLSSTMYMILIFFIVAQDEIMKNDTLNNEK